MESRPPVSLHGSEPDRQPDVLDSGSESEPRLTPAARRRLRRSGVALLVAIAAVAGAVEVQERRDAAAEDRRLAGLLQLSSPDRAWEIVSNALILSDANAASPQPVEMDMKVLVRNDGPREITVTRASAGGFVLLGGPVAIPAQTTVELALQQTVKCSVQIPRPSHDFTPGPVAAPGPLQIIARTSRGTRTVTIAQPPYQTDYAAFACAVPRNAPPPGDVTVMPR